MSQGRSPRIGAIDGFRVFGIGGVVLLHLLGISGVLVATAGTPTGIVLWGLFGNIIDTFFIVSGFALFLPVLRRGSIGSVRDYALGRAARLLPPYWLTLAICLLLLALVPQTNEQAIAPLAEMPSLPDVLANVFALQMPARMFDGGFVVGFGVDGPLWMISVMVGFYVVFPFVAGAYRRHPLIGLLAGLAITVLWKELVFAFGPQLADLQGGAPVAIARLIAIDQLPGWAFSFALGMTGAWAYLAFRDRAATPALRPWLGAITGVALVVFLLCAWRYGELASGSEAIFGGSIARADTWMTVAYSASRAVLMAAVVVGPAWLERPFASRPTNVLAELSYGLYLIHIPVAIYVGTMLLGLPTDGSVGAFFLWAGVVFPLGLAYAWVVVRLVERPVRRWVRRVTRRSDRPVRYLARPRHEGDASIL